MALSRISRKRKQPNDSNDNVARSSSMGHKDTTDTQASKKRTLADASVTSPAAKRPRKETPPEPKSSPKKEKGKTTPNATPPKLNSADVPPAGLPPAVTAKVNAVHAFISQKPGSLLQRTGPGGHRIHLPEVELLAALMAATADYELGDPYGVDVADVEDAIEARVEAAHHITGEPVVSLVIDTEMRSSFERRLQSRVARCGLEGVSLLEVELEAQALARREMRRWITIDGQMESLRCGEGD
ncbi:hypothetical protein K431DRAFT_288229 [Polychaeton citri CBS 116435]|uniref:Uncharacterized protein n=1 Tax=Polychaeton citri CBS 116435 TaxID=1314669 RepID=A0A9P4UKT2_9PEZI|nr:hypothetical protein K431DRAFT_288229 [Polychaeton citri CBS 116435]